MSEPTLNDLIAVLREEAEEMRRRAAVEPDERWRIAFTHKARAFLLACDWVRALGAGRRPGQGGYSIATRDFHEHGKPFTVVHAECLAAKGIEFPCDDVSDAQLGGVSEFESDKTAVVQTSGVPPVLCVGVDDGGGVKHREASCDGL